MTQRNCVQAAIQQQIKALRPK